MFGGNDTTDKALQKSVTRRLERSGAGSQSGLTATVQHGTVTLAGKLKYENQRLPILKAIRGVSGVRQVIDQLQSPPKVKPQPPQHDSR
jgi:osmotically-inducible protein OsmY